MRLMEKDEAVVAAVCRSAIATACGSTITRARTTAATAACRTAVVGVAGHSDGALAAALAAPILSRCREGLV
jgi:NH3-dependent NAD+ synthetase